MVYKSQRILLRAIHFARTDVLSLSLFLSLRKYGAIGLRLNLDQSLRVKLDSRCNSP